MRKCIEIIKDIKKYYFTHCVVIGYAILYFLLGIASFFIVNHSATQANDISVVTGNFPEVHSFEDWIDLLGILSAYSIAVFYIAILTAFLLIPVIEKHTLSNKFILTNKWYDLFYKTNIAIIAVSFLYFICAITIGNIT